ncbi:MAG: MBL fold metallo-hydrolase [Nanoarchaeota archaeon]|nr:MBL fold metallo-hydrolase [Nanoarchaeota archaeon]
MIKKFGDVIMIRLGDTESNIYLIDDVAIDAGTGLNFSRMRDLLGVAKKKLSDVKLVVNTHCHFDHCGGNGFFIDAKIAIHKDDAAVLEKGDVKLAAADWFNGNMKPRPVDQKLKDGDIIKAGPLTLQVIHVPGHTAGSICLYDKKNKLLFTGDTIFENGVGRIDFANSLPDQFEASINKIATLPVKTYYPGHGKQFDAVQFKKVLSMAVDPDDLPV